MICSFVIPVYGVFHILSKVFVPFRARAQRILSRLVEQGLLEVRMNTESRQSKKRYVITEKGADVLDYFEKAKDILPFEVIYASART